MVAAAQELARLDPGNPDPGGIVSDAKAKIRDAELADRYAQAINHLDQEEWQQAADLFTAIEQEQPGYREAAALLTTAQRQRDLAGWSDQAAAAAGQDDWDAVVAALEKICAVDPTYQDAGVRLEQARSAKRLRTLVDEVTALHQAGRWKEVVAAAEELASLTPTTPTRVEWSPTREPSCAKPPSASPSSKTNCASTPPQRTGNPSSTSTTNSPLFPQMRLIPTD